MYNKIDWTTSTKINTDNLNQGETQYDEAKQSIENGLFGIVLRVNPANPINGELWIEKE